MHASTAGYMTIATRVPTENQLITAVSTLYWPFVRVQLATWY